MPNESPILAGANQKLGAIAEQLRTIGQARALLGQSAVWLHRYGYRIWEEDVRGKDWRKFSAPGADLKGNLDAAKRLLDVVYRRLPGDDDSLSKPLDLQMKIYIAAALRSSARAISSVLQESRGSSLPDVIQGYVDAQAKVLKWTLEQIVKAINDTKHLWGDLLSPVVKWGAIGLGLYFGGKLLLDYAAQSRPRR